VRPIDEPIHCLRCNRVLTNPKARERLFGTTCYAKVQAVLKQMREKRCSSESQS
jgi:hypothetical protein